VLTVIENQALVWLGAAMSPFLPLLGAASNALHFAVQKLLAMHCFAPPKKPYSASRTSTIAHGLMLGGQIPTAVSCSKDMSIKIGPLPRVALSHPLRQSCGGHTRASAVMCSGAGRVHDHERVQPAVPPADVRPAPGHLHEECIW
jgi:TMC domain